MPGWSTVPITGYGQTGPDKDLPGYDFIIQGRGGVMSITGEAEGEPMKVGVAITDITAGLFAANAIQAALLARTKTGQGQAIDISLLDAQVAWLANVGSNYLVSGTKPGRYGNAHPSIVPYQSFQAQDGYFCLAVGNDGQWQKLCRLIARPELAADERFSTNPARVQNREILIPLLQDVFGTDTVRRLGYGKFAPPVLRAGLSSPLTKSLLMNRCLPATCVCPCRTQPREKSCSPARRSNSPRPRSSSASRRLYWESIRTRC